MTMEDDKKLDEARLDVIYERIINFEKKIFKGMSEHKAQMGSEGFEELKTDFNKYLEKAENLYQKDKFNFNFKKLNRVLPKNKWLKLLSNDYLLNASISRGILYSDVEEFDKAIEKKLNANELFEDAEVVRDNLDHLLTIFGIVPLEINAMLNVHVNPVTGALLDRLYEDNKGFIVRKKRGKYQIDLKCALTERAKQNISNSIYEFTEKYLS